MHTIKSQSRYRIGAIQTNKDARTVWANVLLVSLFTLWIPVSLYLFSSSNVPGDMICIDLLYCVLGIVLGLTYRGSLISPEVLVTTFGFLGYGTCLVMTGNLSPKEIFRAVSLSPEMLTHGFAIFLVAWLAFVGGCRLQAFPKLPWHWIFGGNAAKKPGILIFTMIVACVTFAGVFRYTFRLGVAGELPALGFDLPIIPVTGILQLLLYQGVAVLALWYLASSFKERSHFKVLLAFIPLLIIGYTQAVLKWRGGMLSIFVYSAILFVMISVTGSKWPTLRKKKRLGFAIFLAGLFVASIMISNFGQRQRDAFYRAASNPSSVSSLEWVNRKLHRVWGLPRLAAVVDHFGMSATNDFFITKLLQQGYGTGKYADHVIYGVKREQVHGVGSSGPGGPYMGAGIIGVAFVFFLWGGFWMRIFRYATESENPIAYAFYAISFSLLSASMSENFGAGQLKVLLATLVVSKVMSLVLTHNRLPLNRLSL